MTKCDLVVSAALVPFLFVYPVCLPTESALVLPKCMHAQSAKSHTLIIVHAIQFCGEGKCVCVCIGLPGETSRGNPMARSAIYPEH